MLSKECSGQLALMQNCSQIYSTDQQARLTEAGLSLRWSMIRLFFCLVNEVGFFFFFLFITPPIISPASLNRGAFPVYDSHVSLCQPNSGNYKTFPEQLHTNLWSGKY